MDLDSSLDDLIKKRKGNNHNKPRKQQGKNNAQQQTKSRPALNVKSRAKVTKPQRTGGINSRLSASTPTVSGPLFTSKNQPKRIADPSQIIITKAIPPSQRNKKTHIDQPSVLAGRLVSNFSIRGRSSTVANTSGLSIRGESGPTLILVTGLDPGTNDDDVKCAFEQFGSILSCEVLRDRQGRSFGEAEIEFSSKTAALDCIAKLDNQMADGHYLRVILRENKPKPTIFKPKPIQSVISTPSYNASGKMYADQIAPRYDIRQNFATQVRGAYINQNQITFSQLLTIDVNNPTVIQLLEELVYTNEDQAQQIVDAVLEDTSVPLSKCIANYLQVLRHSNESIALVFETFATFYTSLTLVFKEQDSYYLVSVVCSFSSDLVDLALRADKTGLKGRDRKANTAVHLLSKVFNIMLVDRSPMETSKRQGIVHITNLSFKVYFQLNNMRMCKTLMSNLRTGGVKVPLFPIAHQVTFKYYTGRYSLYHGQLKKASENLLFAFERCQASQWHNKRVILHHLIPTRIILGYFPSIELLQKYKLTERYLGLIQTIRTGNMRGYLQHLETHFEYFYHHLTYLLLKERGIVLVWRCLIKNMHTQKLKLGAKIPVLEFGDCLKAFQVASDEPYTIYDMECILVSLVSQGYVHHTRQRVVLSKVNAFPPISQVRVYTEVYNDEVIQDHMDHAQPQVPEDIQEYMNE
ncbi:hypothetical protein INT48_009591 [Thamnidium elegans]|uniref:RRM domain-containing protein n=1 Tax=Thamnidium elegans TaxID=101142 RepID=A0A8H7SID5_9FUNG|nr:hypothetical protein INT48_009591 [Thamnidium elegans]